MPDHAEAILVSYMVLGMDVFLAHLEDVNKSRDRHKLFTPNFIIRQQVNLLSSHVASPQPWKLVS